MEELKALQLIDNYLSILKLSRKEHEELVRAVLLLESSLKTKDKDGRDK